MRIKEVAHRDVGGGTWYVVVTIDGLGEGVIPPDQAFMFADLLRTSAEKAERENRDARHRELVAARTAAKETT